MNIGIIVESKTGNTLSVAEKLQKALQAKEHAASIDRVVAEGEVKPGPGMKDVRFKEKPDVGEYDGTIFCSHVEAFSLSPVMKAYLSQVGPLSGKRIACFVTKHLPGYWTGGNRAIRQMRGPCQKLGGDVRGSGIIIWSSKEKEQMIEKVVSDLSALF